MRNAGITLVLCGLITAASAAQSITREAAPVPKPSVRAPSDCAWVETGVTPSVDVGFGVLRYVVGGDFDGDGDVDGAVFQTDSTQSNDPSRATVLLNNSDQTFSESAVYPTSPSFGYLPLPHMEDFDNDGDVDLLVRSSAGFVGFIPNTGDGQFAEGAPVWSDTLGGQTARSGSIDTIVTGDFDGDGDIDLLFADESTSSDRFDIRLLRNDGSGFFVSENPSLSGLRMSRTIVVGDTDNDGHLDLAWHDRSTGLVVISRGDGAGQFDAPEFLSNGVPHNYGSIVIGDLNGDGSSDILVNYQTGPTPNDLYLGNGSGGFDVAPPTGVSVGGRYIPSAIDIDGDSDTDFVFRASYTEVGTLLNDGSGHFSRVPSYRAPSGNNGRILLDADGDGDQDVLAVGNESYSVLVNSGGGEFDSDVALMTSGSRGIGVSDMDGDGYPEVVVAGVDISIFQTQGDSLIDPPQAYDGPIGVADMALADFDADGAVDVAVVGSEVGNVMVRLNDGSGSLLEPTIVSIDPGAVSMNAADIDGDGDQDLVVVFGSGPPSLLENQGGGVFSAPTALGFDANHIIRFGDMNGDGLVDAHVVKPTARLFLNRPDDPGQFDAGAATWNLPTPLASILGDIDGDGDNDIISTHWSSDPDPPSSSISFSINNGDATFGGSTLMWTTGMSNGLIPLAVTDVDGDGDMDAIASDGFMLVYLINDGGASSFRAYDARPMSQILRAAPIDLESDGDTDLAIINGGSVFLFTVESVCDCATDFNGDHQINFFDIVAFLAAFNAGDLAADFRADGVLNFFDIVDYITLFNNGCP